ncbi:hypothetical protein CONPUDRAFT_140893 [Coniophora puteana RWD-64-598 SS2]|uniref:Uncharacterized protein n=1 Tax=Coniophora puteana (strain RWD-64-598) TaxID=741705 RepID=A0A5M3N4L5_CONPW|nr:uncharacterized protein CONPUDRAFT_140893 [Coniophora puteana RWD-64-598 SS2]EIW86248.1 hypothetical protein CONPUDRAFT_140893 [Coniophora puteana RWD-64-598 SS2]
MLSRAKFALLVSTIRQANAKTYYSAYTVRLSARPTFHAQRLAYWIGLRISLSKAYTLEQKYIAARPMPQLATPSPVLDLVYPYSEEELMRSIAVAPPLIHMATHTHTLQSYAHAHPAGASCQPSDAVDWQQQQHAQGGPSATRCGDIPYIIVSPPESSYPPHHHHSSLYQPQQSQHTASQSQSQSQAQTRLTIRIPPMSLVRCDDALPVPGAPLLGTMDLPMIDDTQYDSEASDLSTSSSSEEALTPEPMDVSPEEPAALRVRLAPKRKLQDVEDEDCAYETLYANDTVGQPEGPKYAMKRRWRHASPSRSGAGAPAPRRRTQRC